MIGKTPTRENRSGDRCSDPPSMKGIPMNWLLIALLIVIAPLSAAYSGTYVDDFSDGNVDDWIVSTFPPGFPNFIRFEDWYLVMDTIVGGNEVLEDPRRHAALQLSTGNAEEWDSYSLTCRIRFVDVQEVRPPESFTINVRKGKGHIGLAPQQNMQIHPLDQFIHVTTYPPDAKRNFEKLKWEGLIRRQILVPEPFLSIQLNRWLPVEIVAEKKSFEFDLTDELVVHYVDKTAVPGTEEFATSSRMRVHLDDVTITGPNIPNSAGTSVVNLATHLTTTWGKIKNSPRR